MRKTKTFKIEGYEKSFTVNELTVKQIISLTSEEMLSDVSIARLKENFETRLLPICSNIEMSDFAEMAPSEIKQIWENFKEVNSDFFEIARKAGLDSILTKLKEALIADFSNFVADSSKQDT